MVFLLPLAILVLYVLLFLTAKKQYLIAVAGIATAEYIYWLSFVGQEGRLAPSEGVTYIDLALVPTVVFVSVLVLAFYARRRGIRAVSA